MLIWRQQELRWNVSCVKKKYDDIITQRETDSQVDGNMADVKPVYLEEYRMMEGAML